MGAAAVGKTVGLAASATKLIYKKGLACSCGASLAVFSLLAVKYVEATISVLDAITCIMKSWVDAGANGFTLEEVYFYSDWLTSF